MALPKVSHPTRTVKLPLSGIEVKFRPFLVKEEKILIMLRESEDATPADFLEAISNMITSVCITEIDPMKLPAPDLEFLFLRIRSLSKGNISRLGYNCKNEVEKTDHENKKFTGPCGHVTEVEVDLDKIEVTHHDGHTKAIPVPGTDLVVHFRYPTLHTTKRLAVKSTGGKANKLDIIEVTMIDCLDMVTQGDEVMTPDTEQQVRDFMEDLPDAFFQELEAKFMNLIPSLETDVDFKCEKCGYGESIHLKGLKDFF